MPRMIAPAQSLSWVMFSLLLNLGAAREEIKFDFGWRFHLGDLTPFVNCNSSAFPRDLSGVQCTGLKSNQANSSDDCRNACCGDLNCAIWQFAKDKGCWIGNSKDCTHKNADWVGGGRDVPAPIPPPSKTGPTSRGYDDSSWELVDVPHDGIISGNYSETDGPEKQAYLPKNTTWYRKHFNLPSEWKGQSIWVYFEGVFRASIVYLNGQQLVYHDSGYTSFPVRLDTAINVYYGDGKDNENVLVVRATYESESGWWYEGCGIYRHVYLVSANPVYLLPDGIYGGSNVTGQIQTGSSRQAEGMVAEEVKFYFRADVINSQMSGKDVSVMARFTIYDESEKNLKSVTTSSVTIKSGQNTTIRASATLSNIEMWSNLRPYFYTLQTELLSNSMTLDAVNVTIGVRQTRWDPNTGFYLNGISFVWRGFNNHNNFAGVGMAVPDRVDLFRGQSMRAVGANAWRMSHNPPIPVMLDILDRLGIVVWDENRQFGDNTVWVENQLSMVKRDRNHPSIMAWSFCNEAGCSEKNQTVCEEFRNVSYSEDSFRPVTANMNGGVGGVLTQVIDVQGFSHRPGSMFDDFHKQFPNKPLIGSECCSCRTQRMELATDKQKKIFGNFNADCNKDQTLNQLSRPFVAGCMVWTLFDYYGEPTPYGWPHVSSSFGSIDLAGFAKASAYWYRTWWLYEAKRTKRKDVTFNPPSLVNPGIKQSEDNSSNEYFVYIVQHWDPIEGEDTRTVQVYTNAPNVQLYLNGVSQGTSQVDTYGWAEFDSVKYASGNITAVAYQSSPSSMLASFTRVTSGRSAKVVASIDVPNESTGTGSALVLDGQDTGMVNAAILDTDDRLVYMASNNVTFRIVSGPGRIIGVGNGDPTCHEPNKATWRSAYHGLARVIVQVTKDQASKPLHRKRLLQIDSEGGVRTTIVPPGVEEPLEDIIVEASVEGLGSSQVTIPVSTDPDKDGVLSVAERWYKM